MKVLKFGGTSVGSARSIRNVRNIIEAQQGRKIVVVSAMSGVTNMLVEINELLKKDRYQEIENILQQLETKHFGLIEELFTQEEIKASTKRHFSMLLEQLKDNFSEEAGEVREATIVTFGETVLSYIFSRFLEAEGLFNTLLDAKDFMHVSSLENPEVELVNELLIKSLHREISSEIYITQGFVRIDRNRNISTLKRGGSDYTATIIAAAINAREVQIWTDIDGFHNNDPRFVDNTVALSQLTFEEAAELAYFGAKILHPQTVSPVKDRNIPIFLKNTFTPEAAGTKISSEVTNVGLKAISAKDDITAIKIKSNRMLMAHGFLKKIFEVFDKHETAIDMITTSEIAISLTIDNPVNLHKILDELEEYGEISVDTNHSIICVVGEGVINDKDTFRLFEILNDIPVRMISYGGSNNNISLLVDTRNKIQALRMLNRKLFEERSYSIVN
ncbi:MAG: aspartate kinase [Salinimicrobium sp.]